MTRRVAFVVYAVLNSIKDADVVDKDAARSQFHHFKSDELVPYSLN